MSAKHLAYGPDRHAIETVMRLHAVKRWHMIDTTRQQTLAEHSANVALLAMTIVLTCPIAFFDKAPLVAAASLVHDIPEAFTGDIPTHTKTYLRGLEELEESVTHPAFVPYLKGKPGQLAPLILPCSRLLIKLCDLADGIRFIRLHGVDTTARHAREGLEEQLGSKFQDARHALCWPEEVLKHVRNNLTFYAYENS